MLKPTDTVQRAEAVGRPACSPPVFISSHFGGAPRLVWRKGGRGTRRKGSREKERRRREKETTRLDEALAACGIIKIQPCTNCWPVLPLLLLFPPPLYPFCTFSWSFYFSSSSSSASSTSSSSPCIFFPHLPHLPFAQPDD